MHREQKRLYTVHTVDIGRASIEIYSHNNGISIIPNTQSNWEALKTITKEDIQNVFTIVDEEDEAPAETSYKKYLYIVRKKARSRSKK